MLVSTLMQTGWDQSLNGEEEVSWRAVFGGRCNEVGRGAMPNEKRHETITYSIFQALK